MNLLKTQETPKTDSLEPARRPFNWIEVVIIPIASCLMEVQPIAFTLILLSFTFSGGVNAWPLGEVSMTLLLLGLRWWAMLVYGLMRRGMSKSEGQPLQVLGLIIALAAMIITHLWFVSFLGAAIVGGALVVWFWWRGSRMAQIQEREENLIQYFKIGFGLLVLELFIAVFTSDDVTLHATAARIFSTFFLSGLLALSFSRLSGMKESGANGTAQTTSTRNWLVALTSIWVIVVILSLTLETFSFQFIQNVLQPFWNVLGWLVTAILYVFNLLFGGLFSWLNPKAVPITPLPPNHNPTSGAGPSTISPQALATGRLIILIIVFALLIFVIMLFLRRWNVHFHEDDEEEVRESLPVREIARERQEAQRRAQSEAELETLPPNSARAQYRDLLQTMAWEKNVLARRPEETPNEYQQRLVTLLQQSSSNLVQDNSEQSDANVLDDLTQAYKDERYGGEYEVVSQPAYTHSWVERLAKRLSSLNNKGIS